MPSPPAHPSGSSRGRRAADPARWATGLLWVAAAGVCWQAVVWNADFLHDDAYITLRYARNWLEGNGVGWNPGDRVEGYTNFGQLLLVAGLGAAGVGGVAATRVIAAAAWCGLLVFGLLRARGGAAAVSLALAPTLAGISLLVWCFGGLEAPLLALCLTVGSVWMQDALRAAPRVETRALAATGLALGLGCLTRLDAGLFVAAAVAFLLVSFRGPARRRAILRFALPVALILLPWLLWKWHYYGGLLPNTYYAKAPDPSAWRLSAGARYVAGFVLAPPFPLPWLAAGLSWAALRGTLSRADAFAGTAVALSLAWVAYVGGDQMPAYRLLVPLLPVSAFAALALFRDRVATGPSRGVAAAAVAACVLAQLAWPGLAGPHRNSTAFVGEAVGRYMHEHFRPGSLVALNTAGSTPYHAPGLRYLDMLGLNDAHIARREIDRVRVPGQRIPGHLRGDGAYVLAQRPDYIILGPAAGVSSAHPWFLSDLEIARDPAFARDYRMRIATLDLRATPGYADHPETASGALRFSYYERRRP